MSRQAKIFSQNQFTGYLIEGNDSSVVVDFATTETDY